MSEVVPERCRGCGRPLKTPVAVLAGYGAACARRHLGEAQQDPVIPAAVSDGLLTSVALVSAHLQQIDVPRADLLEGVDPGAVIRSLTQMVGRLLQVRPEPAENALQRLAAFAVNERAGGAR